MSYLEKKRNLYYAILKIPSDLREHFGKTKFSKSTGQADPRKARSIALGFVSEWQKQIQAARKLALDADLQMALEMRRDIEAAIESGEDDPGVAYGISDFIDKLRETGQKERAEKFACVVFGKEVVLAEYYEAWVVSIKTTSQRTRIEYSNIGREVLKMFPTVSAITPKAVRAWARMMLDGNGNYDAPLSKSSIEKRFKVARNLWQYLEYHELVDQEANPFRLPRFVSEADKKLRAERLKTKGRAEERLPFEPYELVEIWRNASQSDPQLADLIFLAMYTGCRIEELCRLKVRECTNSLLKVTSSKTKAGYRDIPVHPKLKPLVQRLLRIPVKLNGHSD
ncbi:hypothetical protein FJM67_15785 [Maribrevibacterium harenarium]|uniref:Tyr recombinase domain-containing protein n=1 Tax=Maribrevibacterium harenarium TaxID=2589817 RepID=A0A501WLU2_9GAMM|nr:DUF6538 domain-containing protein [Maribrevibacterium harenarium]TPE46656.1 hypothetical protein FJM67_15785 [Maribrevibacterium harenarium]